MSIGDRIRALFAPEKADLPQVQGEVGWSETTIYSTRDFPKYNPDDLLSRKGYGIYRKMMTDEQVKAVVRFKRDAITSRDWYFECEHDDLTPEEKDERIEFFCKAANGIRGSWLDAMNGIMSAMYHGFSMTEKVYRVEDTEYGPRIVPDKLRLRPFDTFYFYTDTHGSIIRIVQKLEGTEQDIDADKFIHYVQNPDYDEHYGSSELREAYRAWFSKDITIRMQNIYLERMASGFIWVAPKEGKSLSASSTEYAQLQKVLTNISTKTALILPSGMELNVVHPSNTDAYERAISQADKAIAKALLVPNLMGISEQGQTGSYSQSQTQLEAFLWTLDADATRLEEILNEQLFKEVGDLNYGDGYYPKFRFKPVSDAKKMEIVRTWQSLVQAGAVEVTETDEAHLRELLDIPSKPEMPEEPEYTLNGAQVSSVIDIAAKVNKGELSQDAAITILTSSFPISAEDAGKIVSKAETVEPAPVAAPVAPVEIEEPEDEDELPDETIVGQSVLKSSKHRFYNEDQPRDENGRWGSGGSGGRGKITSDEKSSLSSYSGDSFLSINSAMRNGDSDTAEIKRIESAIDKSGGLSESMTVYRGVDRETAKKIFGGSINKGDVVQDKAFVSTSKDFDLVASSYGSGGVVFEIAAPAGTSGIDMSKYSSNKNEKEILLQRNSKFKVLGVKPPKNPASPIIVRMEVV